MDGVQQSLKCLLRGSPLLGEPRPERVHAFVVEVEKADSLHITRFASRLSAKDSHLEVRLLDHLATDIAHLHATHLIPLLVCSLTSSSARRFTLWAACCPRAHAA